MADWPNDSSTSTSIALAAATMSGVNRAKHLVKHNPALFGLVQKLRSALYR